MNTSPATITPPAEQVIQGEPPPATQQSTHGSVGAVAGVVAAIVLLGIIAGVIGRLCGRRSVMGSGGRFDIEGWAETKCSTCIDGNVDGPPPTCTVAPAAENGGGGREERERSNGEEQGEREDHGHHGN